jgi:hypothetical protein
MCEWFTKDGVLEENDIQAIECGTTKKNPKLNMLELKEHPKLKNGFSPTKNEAS